MRSVFIPGVALTGALFLAGSSAPSAELQQAVSESGSASNSTQSTAPVGPDLNFGLFPITAPEEQFVLQRFQQTERFWAKRYPHLIGVSATKLTVLHSDEYSTCPTPDGTDQVRGDDANATEYCHSLGKIVITSGLADFLHQTAVTEVRTEVGLEFFIDHEFGHAIQAAAGTLKPNLLTTPRQERQADCYAGQAFNVLDPTHIATAESFLLSLPTGDSRHGTPQQRAASFEAGASGEACG